MENIVVKNVNILQLASDCSDMGWLELTHFPSLPRL